MFLPHKCPTIWGILFLFEMTTLHFSSILNIFIRNGMDLAENLANILGNLNFLWENEININIVIV